MVWSFLRKSTFSFAVTGKIYRLKQQSYNNYRLQPLEGLLILYKFFYTNTGQELSLTCWAKT